MKVHTKEIGFTVHEIITLASIIKGETHKEEEMPRISGVYHNRLRIGMKLQADPTIQYVLPGGWKRLTFKDRYADVPYDDNECFSMTWRAAGQLAADLADCGEHYLDYYCAGAEGYVSPEIREAMLSIGLRPVT